MPEPTDHRAQAEFWVNQFHDRIGPVNPEPRDMLLLAHIHALLALTEAPARSPYATAQTHGPHYNPTRPPLSPSEG